MIRWKRKPFSTSLFLLTNLFICLYTFYPFIYLTHLSTLYPQLSYSSPLTPFSVSLYLSLYPLPCPPSSSIACLSPSSSSPFLSLCLSLHIHSLPKVMQSKVAAPASVGGMWQLWKCVARFPTIPSRNLARREQEDHTFLSTRKHQVRVSTSELD